MMNRNRRAENSACRFPFFMVYKKQKICDNQNNMEPVNCNLKTWR